MRNAAGLDLVNYSLDFQLDTNNVIRVFVLIIGDL